MRRQSRRSEECSILNKSFRSTTIKTHLACASKLDQFEECNTSTELRSCRLHSYLSVYFSPAATIPVASTTPRIQESAPPLSVDTQWICGINSVRTIRFAVLLTCGLTVSWERQYTQLRQSRQCRWNRSWRSSMTSKQANDDHGLQFSLPVNALKPSSNSSNDCKAPIPMGIFPTDDYHRKSNRIECTQVIFFAIINR